MTVAILVPRRSDGGRRDRVWEWIRDRWEAQLPGWKIVEGHHEQGPFNRSAAINTAADQAGTWDLAMVADADSFVAADQAVAAVRMAESHRIVFAYDRFKYLNRTMSDRVMSGYEGDWHPGVEFTLYGTCSSMVAVSRTLWDRVGGFDEGFVGWGMEDVAFSLACQTFGGDPKRIPGDVWHLHHPTSPENHHSSPLYRANVARLERYKGCDCDQAKMTALFAELRP